MYISVLDDLIPVINGAGVFRDHSNGQASTYLIRAICLVTCKTKQAAPFLRLGEDGPLLKPMEFASKLLDGLDAAVKADLEPDRVIKIQILALMHLHNDGLAGVDRSSSYLSQAICEAWSMSLHWTIAGKSDQEQCDYLWWSLRNFDRLNKPVTDAAPFIIDDADIGIDRILPKKDSHRSQLMGVSLIMGDLMKTATRVYKASRKATVDDSQSFPSLSELTSDSNFGHFHRSHRAYLEIWYHVAAMLSCRYSGPGTVQYNRRLSSADRVLEIMSQEEQESLPPLPLVPYAMSMSTTVIYRALHDGERDIDTAYKDLRLCCDALDVLSQRWTSAKGVAKLAKRLWRLISSGSSNRQLRQGNESVYRRSSSEAATIASVNGRSTAICESSEEIDLPLPDPIQAGLSMDGSEASYSNQNFQRQLIEAWPGIDTSYFQPDWAFHDLFDYGLSNICHDPPS